MYDVLLQELRRLHAAFQDYELPLLIGGGMGLFLRDTYYPHHRSPRYPITLPSRSTQDLDVFLSSELIVDATAMSQIRDSLAALGYEPSTKYFQFARAVTLGDSTRRVKVDLLAAPPPASQREAVKITRPRIRPQGTKRIHAFLTEEARSIERSSIAINLSAPGDEQEDTIVYIPSSYNYLILKLHAFDDRKDKDDDLSDRGRHHALDIFRIVTDMTETDWKDAVAQYAEEGAYPYLQRATQIRQACFADERSVGAIRLQENTAYRQRRAEYDDYLSQVLEDLADLFP